LIREPHLLLLDEPGGHWDAPLRRRMRIRIRRWSEQRQTAIVWVTHDRDEAFAAADRLAVLRDGKVLQCDTPRRAYDRPSSLEVAKMLTSPTINSWPCSTSGVDDAPKVGVATVRCGPWTIPADRVPPGAATLAIRPESIRWRLLGDATGAPTSTTPTPANESGADARIEARVAQVEDLGDRRVIVWRGDQCEVVSVDFARGDLDSRQAWLSVSPTDCLWF
jgi:ABC-type sugar transport system ATPase subunit